MTPEVAYFIGVPRRRFDDTEWDAYMERWTFTGPPGIRLSYPGDKCDVARSRHINAAKGNEPLDDVGLGFAGRVRLKEPAAVTISMDSDVWPKMGLADMLRIIHEDFQAGFDVVSAPTVNSESLQTMVWTSDGAPLPTDRALEVTQVAFGFVAFSPKFIREVKPEAEEIFYEGTAMERRVPLYCHFGVNEDDSTTFSKLILEQGFKLGADARLRVAHRKAADLDPASAGWITAYRNISKAGRTDLYLRAMRIVQRGLKEEATDHAGTGDEDDE